MKYQILSIFSAFLLFILISCDSRPKVIEGQSSTTAVHDHDHSPDSDGSSGEAKEREVTVNEVLHTSKYSYLNVTEGNEKFWVAIPKSEVEVGDVYNFRGGLLKKNFKSQEFDRVFETVYLVSDYRKKNTAGVSEIKDRLASESNTPVDASEIKRAAGSVSLSDLMANKEKYSGKLVQVTGKCTKVNNMIMGKNWVHLDDGSGDNLDLTVTTTEMIEVGSVVTLEGTIALNKDFGAGYSYGIIMEGAVKK